MKNIFTVLFRNKYEEKALDRYKIALARLVMEKKVDESEIMRDYLPDLFLQTLAETVKYFESESELIQCTGDQPLIDVLKNHLSNRENVLIADIIKDLKIHLRKEKELLNFWDTAWVGPVFAAILRRDIFRESHLWEMEGRQLRQKLKEAEDKMADLQEELATNKKELATKTHELMQKKEELVRTKNKVEELKVQLSKYEKNNASCRSNDFEQMAGKSDSTSSATTEQKHEEENKERNSDSVTQSPAPVPSKVEASETQEEKAPKTLQVPHASNPSALFIGLQRAVNRFANSNKKKNPDLNKPPRHRQSF